MAIFKQALPEWQKAGTKPPGSMITGGWQSSQKPPADYFNWFFNTTYIALKELQEVADKEFIKRDGSVTMTSALKFALGADGGNIAIINEGSKTSGYATAITKAGIIVTAPVGSDGNPDWTKQLSLGRTGVLDVYGLTIKGEAIALAKDCLPLTGGDMLGTIASSATTPIQVRIPNSIYTWNRGKQADGTVIKVESRPAGASAYTQSLEVTIGSGIGANSADGNFTINPVSSNDAAVTGTVQFGHTLRYSVSGVNITTGQSVAQYWYRVTRSDDGSKNYLQFGAPLDISGIGGTIGAGINFIQPYLRLNGRDVALKDEVLLLTGGEVTGTIHSRAVSIAYTGKVGEIKHYITPQPTGTVIRFELFIDGVWSRPLDVTVGETNVVGTSDYFINPMDKNAAYVTGLGPLEATKTRATVVSSGANTIAGASLPNFWWLRILRNFYDTCIQAGKNLIFSGYGNAQLEKVEFKTTSLMQNGKTIITQDSAAFTSAINFDYKGKNGNLAYANKGDTAGFGWLLAGVDPTGNLLIAPNSDTGGTDLSKKVMIERNGCLNVLNLKINGKQAAITDDVAYAKSEAILTAGLDATAKSNTAVATSNSYTDTEVSTVKNTAQMKKITQDDGVSILAITNRTTNLLTEAVKLKKGYYTVTCIGGAVGGMTEASQGFVQFTEDNGTVATNGTMVLTDANNIMKVNTLKAGIWSGWHQVITDAPLTWTKATLKNGYSHFAGANVYFAMSSDGKQLMFRGTASIANPTLEPIVALTLPSTMRLDFSGAASCSVQNSGSPARVLIDANTNDVTINLSSTASMGVILSFSVPVRY
ncbi:hypothetical protein HCA63_06730 [Listeria booriae]|uniref:hypothetical protein n=1 Tax=Listeria booriae TaxID=1552123 RepID=UPI001629784B|nr:hypothetical protein [Listeria booriae]MBC1888044.1 hypothetical protein [Listeria booriae]